MTTDLIRFTQWARESPQRQYTALMGMLYDPDGLLYPTLPWMTQTGSRMD